MYFAESNNSSLLCVSSRAFWDDLLYCMSKYIWNFEINFSSYIFLNIYISQCFVRQQCTKWTHNAFMKFWSKEHFDRSIHDMKCLPKNIQTTFRNQILFFSINLYFQISLLNMLNFPSHYIVEENRRNIEKYIS